MRGKPAQLDDQSEASRAGAGSKSHCFESPCTYAHFDTRNPSALEKKTISRGLVLSVVMCKDSYEAVGSLMLQPDASPGMSLS